MRIYFSGLALECFPICADYSKRTENEKSFGARVALNPCVKIPKKKEAASLRLPLFNLFSRLIRRVVQVELFRHSQLIWS